MSEITAIAGMLDAAAMRRAPIVSLAHRYPLDREAAYAVQSLVVEHRLSRGERLVGLKLGFTSEAMRRQRGILEPNYGWLTSGMDLGASETLPSADFIHPRAEPEIAIRLGRALSWPVNLNDAAAAVEGFAPAIEIVDSRFCDYRFNWLDNIADNSSAAAFRIGEWRTGLPPAESVRVTLERAGHVLEVGSTDAVMGHPLNALCEGVRQLHYSGRSLSAGMVVLTGGITKAVSLASGQSTTANFGNLGCVHLHVD